MERNFVSQYLLQLTKLRGRDTSQITQNLTDDVAYVDTNNLNLQDFIITSDSLVQGRHIMFDINYACYAKKLFFRNLSDIIVKNAVPVCYMLNIFVGETTTESDLILFTKELKKLNRKFNIFLIGGDTSVNFCKIPAQSAFIASMTMIGRQRDKRNFARLNAKNSKSKLYILGKIGGAYLGFLEANFIKDTIRRKFFDNYIFGTVDMKKTHQLFDANDIISTMDISDGILVDIPKFFTDSNNLNFTINDFKFEKPIEMAIKLCSVESINDINYFINFTMQNANCNNNDCFASDANKSSNRTDLKADFDVFQKLQSGSDGVKNILQDDLQNFIKNAILFGDDYNFCYYK